MTASRIFLDTATNRVGEVSDEIRARPDGPITSIWLQPVGGGYEWRAEPANCHPWNPREENAQHPGGVR